MDKGTYFWKYRSWKHNYWKIVTNAEREKVKEFSEFNLQDIEECIRDF